VALNVSEEDKMPQFEVEDYKFPDEIAQQVSPEVEIEIEDDTPEEDRGRTPMPKELVAELEQDELETYDEGVKTKLKQMRKVWHDERREKEAALREQQEALAFARKLLEENKKIKEILTTGEKEYASTIQSAAAMELDAAKREYKEAFESGDSDRVLEAQQQLQSANMKLMQAKSFKLPPLQEEEYSVQTESSPSQSSPDPKLNAWRERNSWFGHDDEMTAAALGLHRKLERSGAVPIGSDAYYDVLDKTMRRRFPEAFEAEEAKSQPPKPKAGTVVAPAVRSTASNKVRLKASQVQIAKKLGLTPEQYAKEALKLEVRNG
jgi:hypothetical protein